MRPGPPSRLRWTTGEILNGDQAFVFTGPPLRVSYSGCRFNKLVLVKDNEHFNTFLDAISDRFREIVSASPELYKPGASFQFRFEFVPLNAAEDGDLLKCRLLTVRYPDLVDPSKYTQVASTQFYTDAGILVSPTEVTSNSTITPVFQVGYFREGDRFKLYLTCIKGKYQESAVAAARDYELDEEDEHV